MKSKIYVDLAIKDVFRLWSASQLQVIIIAGICLPILMLLGLKNGHVADLREDLVTSPVGRQVIFWSAKEGEFLTDDVIEGIETEIPNVDLIIPDSQKLVFVSEISDKQSSTSDGEALTLYSTLPGDPLLDQFDADIGRSEIVEDPIVLSKTTAAALKSNVGDTLSVKIKRRFGPEEQEHTLSFQVTGIVESGRESDGLVAFAHANTLTALEKYTTGEAVAELGIDAMESLKAVDRYSEMLLVCFRGQSTDLSDNDHKFLAERGLVATEVYDPDTTSLYGTLLPRAAEELKFYTLRFLGEEDSPTSYIRDNPKLLTRNTEAQDDFILRWPQPIDVKYNDKTYQLIGMTLPEKRESGGWLQNFVRPDAFWFTYEESLSNPLSMKGRPEIINELDGQELPLTPSLTSTLDILAPLSSPLKNDTDTENNVKSRQPLNERANTATLERETQLTVYVPTTLLAFSNQIEQGEVVLDLSGKRFLPAPSPISFTKARLYTDTIDDVPLAAELLADKKYAVLSEVSRIAEIQEQNGSLQVLVTVVALGVFLFGVITVFSVLVDSTDRKKGMIGIFRVMGVSSGGVFLILLVRAIVIGIMAAAVCCGIGVALAGILGKTLIAPDFLSWLPQVRVVLGPTEYLLVVAGAILCAALGVLLPAFKASRLDPFDAIMEGQFH